MTLSRDQILFIFRASWDHFPLPPRTMLIDCKIAETSAPTQQQIGEGQGCIRELSLNAFEIEIKCRQSQLLLPLIVAFVVKARKA